MTTKLKSPAGGASYIFYKDGTNGVVDANGFLDCPVAFVSDMLTAGFTIAAGANDALPLMKYTDMADTTAATMAAGSLVAADCTIDMAGTLGAGAALTLPTVAALVAALPEFTINQAINVRIINSGAGAFAWTVTTNTGWTLAGTQSIAQNTWRDFYLTIQSATAATLTARGTGTNS